MDLEQRIVALAVDGEQAVLRPLTYNGAAAAAYAVDATHEYAYLQSQLCSCSEGCRCPRDDPRATGAFDGHGEGRVAEAARTLSAGLARYRKKMESSK